MTIGLGITLGAILGLLLVSAFFSGSETALTAASRAKMHALEEDGNARARVVNYLLTIRERFIGAILLGNTLANVAASALATSLFLTLFGEEGVVYATVVMTVIVVLFVEVLPKTYAILNADRMALAVAPARPFRGGGAGAGDRRHAVPGPPHACGCSASRSATTPRCSRPHEEIRGAIELHHKEGGVVKTHPRHAGRRARSPRADRVGHHGAPDQDGHDRRRSSPRGDRRCGAEKLAHAAAAVARRARGDRRHPARQDAAPRASRRQGRRRQDRYPRAWRRRHGSCPTPPRSRTSSTSS